MSSSQEIVWVTTTVSSSEGAKKIAQALVERRLAACVQVDGPITSYYRWSGEVQVEPEFRLTIKTSHSIWPTLREQLAEMHPYDEPEIIMAKIDDASASYRAWVLEQTR